MHFARSISRPEGTAFVPMNSSLNASGLDNLTPSQQQVVTHFHGPLLVLAGPGSGKTRVITRRIALLIERGIDPRKILAITFTNKAADEMFERVVRLLPGCRVWISTFHRFCARLLRAKAEFVGLKSNFSIFDTADQRQLIRQVLRQLDIDASHFPAGKIAARISRAKNDMQTAEQCVRSFQDSVGDHTQAVMARVYPEYQKLLLKSNAVDFDDLLLHVVTLLTENVELRREMDERYEFVLVDEYQDTNLAQYRIVTALSRDHPNLCVTGDPDQSIYGWRGAQIGNILRFESDFPSAKVVRLEQNFRSTKQILRAADRLITHNRYRKDKRLVTDNQLGTPVQLCCFRDGRHEADWIGRKIRECVESGEFQWSDCSVFYRVNALSRELEIGFTRQRIPYQVTTGVAFYERAEIKDLLAYLRIIENAADQTAFQRIVNKPSRGIGKKTRGKLVAWADSQSLTFLEACRRADEIPDLSPRAMKAVKSFARLMAELSLDEVGSIQELLEKIIQRTRYTKGWEDSLSEKDIQCSANIDELLSAAHQYDEMYEEEWSLEGFLETASLASDVDSVDKSAGKVTLMTLHAAKGLEFSVVFIVAVEHNVIPHERSLHDGNLRELEEERRLLFVGMTRAKEQLYLTHTIQRKSYGRKLYTIPSEFIAETELVQTDYSKDVEQTTFGESESSTSTNFVDDASSNKPGRIARGQDSSRSVLTTGAALLNGSAEPVDPPQGFAVGMQVRHPQFGLGTVVAISGFSKRRTVTVKFNDDRRKTFVASICPLQPVGIR